MTTIFVNLNASGSNNGTSWHNAYNKLQTAINNAKAGDEIWVAAGTYRPTNGTDRNISFVLKDGIKMYGGFAGTETNFSQRNITKNETILSGDLGTQNYKNDNSYHVVNISDTTKSSVLSGFTISDGNANYYSNNNDSGGGIYSANSQAILSDLKIANNFASDDGGGLFNTSSSPTLNNVTFNGNIAKDEGGAIYNTSSNPEIVNASFLNNGANVGGSIYNDIYSNPAIEQAIFKNNVAQNAGGGIYNGAISNGTVIANSLFEGNISLLGGGVYNYNSEATIINSTFTNNQSRYGAAIRTQGSDILSVTNSIIWGNDSFVDGNPINNFGTANTTINNSLVEGGYNGGNIFTNDPQFVNPDAGDFRLNTGSPTINKGDNNAIAGYSQDLAGNSRILNNTVDLGAYEGLGILSSVPSLSNGQIIYVNDDASGSNNGSNWTNAYNNLQDAIASAPFGSQIWVAGGTYKPSQSDRSVSFNLKNGVAIYGGFAGNETNPNQRNIANNTTILSGDIGVVNDKTDNSYHVVNASNTTSATILNGFTISDGNANYYSNNNDYGGGIYAVQSQAVFANLTIKNNNANLGGGGIYSSSSSNQFINVNFLNNNAKDDGGGIYVNDSFNQFINVSFFNNSASDKSYYSNNYGGAIYSSNSNLIIDGGLFTNNAAEETGGAIYNSYSSNFNINNAVFRDNKADNGGAIYNYDSDSSSTITNSIFDSNTADTNGGAIYNYDSYAFGENLTFYNNIAKNGAAVYSDGGTPIYRNSIFWGNQNTSDSSSTPIYNNGSANTIVRNSIVEGGYNGLENLDANPSLSNPDAGDFRLQPGSPAINSGINEFIVEDTDLIGNHRLVGKVDMGAYEYFDGQNLISNPGTIGDSNIPVSDGFYLNISSQDSLALTTVHRFYQYERGFHFYTSDSNEVDYVRQQSEVGNLKYNYEAEKFSGLASNKNALTGELLQGAKPVYRFFNNDTGAHLYTMDEVEKNYIQNNLSNYGFEDIKYYAFEVEPQNIETLPVYRMLNNDTGTHLLTVDKGEIDYIANNLPNFSFEGNGDGITFHVLPV